MAAVTLPFWCVISGRTPYGVFSFVCANVPVVWQMFAARTYIDSRHYAQSPAFPLAANLLVCVALCRRVLLAKTMFLSVCKIFLQLLHNQHNFLHG
jgi:hypothetical protein